ncbi:class I SAM-dependent methyltransferase [Ketobacter sp. GenoA1]|uniref:class I SAM-dependent methyltransferase n=1 Tax=Ketobacter sp. GenoA1 TaxID=2072747 RepID=UPI000F0D755B|nr:class I SAM-dependent methyltransferase [Ketobacter sp. GenoA1]RLT89652.1 MAG: class I SAM-dependent methyltransferase [Ketobacter sp. GenoA1]
MATVEDHYENVLSEIYSWMFGGFESGIQRNVEFIERHNLVPAQSKIAIDLGAGCGFQTIPLASKGYSVTAIDFDASLLDELKANSGNLTIQCIRDDLINFNEYVAADIELIVCMTDTLLHLDSKEKVDLLFSKAFSALEARGRLVITYRDLSCELTDTDRILPVKSDENTIFTCFLEYERETVKVNDIVYKKSDNGWDLFKSFYRKLRLSNKWVLEHLSLAGFNAISSNTENGVTTVIATK